MSLASVTCRPRFDYVLIWGHGLQYQNEILEILEEAAGVEIRKIFSHRPRSIQTLVNQIYSHDYAPIQHLKGKVRYLLTTPPQVLFIFFQNHDPRIDYHGENAYRHEESGLIRSLKENIRNRYNPKNPDGSRTENHVIHASDSVEQTDLALKILGIREGIQMLENQVNWTGVPSHIQQGSRLSLELKALSELCATINRDSAHHVVAIEDTPHYQGLTREMAIYQNYLSKYLGTELTDYYSVKKFKRLAKSLTRPETEPLIAVKKVEGKFRIQDGLHRAAVYRSRGLDRVPVLILE